MKNVITVTFQNAYNYGAILQCFALQETIKKLKINCYVLNYNNPIIKKNYNIFKIPRSINDIKSNLSNLLYFKRMYKRNKNYRAFIKKYINLTSKMNYSQIKQLQIQNITLIAGSDQVWNTDLTNGFDDIYFLNFGKKVRKISYAASLGKKEITSTYIENIKKSLNNFDYISVREETGKNILKKLISKDIDIVLDPTLLLTKKDWEKFISSKRTIKEKYVLVYMPNNEVIKIVQDLANKQNLRIVNLFKKGNYGAKEINRFDANPFEFIELVKNATYIVTTSFHATVFSIIFNKTFWVIPPDGVSSRITDLLNKLNLNDRAIKNYKEYLELDSKKLINYEYANKVINDERKKSLNKLKTNI